MTESVPRDARVLVVDDQPPNVRLLEAILAPRGYDVLTASSGEEALERSRAEDIDLVLLDIVMPGMDGYEVCRRIRDQADTAYLPVVMVTASGDEQKVKALEAGADDFLTKPINQSELLARVASLARIKRYQDTIKRQAAELAAWNQELESRVETSGVAAASGWAGCAGSSSPQLAELIVDSGDESFLESHRREIVVVFCDLRGFTTFAEASEPEEVMGVLEEYHHALGDLIFRFEGTLERFAGDGLMVFFNDPVRCEDGPLRAIRMSVAMRTRVRGLAEAWARQRARPRARHRDRPGLRDAGQDRLRRSARLRRDRQRDEPGRPAVRRRRAVADPGHRTGLQRRRARWSSARTPGCGSCAASAGPCTRSASGPRQLEGRVMTGDLWTAPVEAAGGAVRADRGGAVPPLRPAAGADGRGVGRRCGSTTTTSRWSSYRRSRWTGP